MALEVHPKRDKAKRDLKSRSKNDMITKKARVRVQIYKDPGESNEDCDQSQKSQNHKPELHNICQDIQNIPSRIGRKVMNSNFSTSLAAEIKPKESSLDVHKRNTQNIIKKRNRERKQTSKAMHSTAGTKEQRNMDTEGNENVEVVNGVMKTMLFRTSICRAKKCQENKTVKDSETEENEEDIWMSEVSAERKYIQKQRQIKNNNSTLGTDLPSSTTEANRAHNGDNADCSDYIPSSAPSSPLHCIDESILQTNNGSNVLPQQSPVHYVSLDTYSVSISVIYFL
jgi:hypothetical protein